MLRKAYVGLGSNVGNRLGNIVAALLELARGARPVGVSSIYETAPVGFEDQGPFLNAACALATAMSPRELLEWLKRLEVELGRTASPRWGPRKIDLDVLAIGEVVVSEADLKIPHERLGERLFACEPLAEIAPDFEPPGLGATVRELRDRLRGVQEARLWMKSDDLLERLGGWPGRVERNHCPVKGEGRP